MSTRFGRFTLIERLGAGGMGEVWRARDGEGRELVVKRVHRALRDDDDFTALFAREARLAAQLEHPNIVTVLASGHVDGEPWLTMELVDGVDLATLLARGAVAPPVAALIISDLARALAYVHDFAVGGEHLGLVHRDVSPSNVLLSRDGAVKLFDFGLARTPEDTRRTKTGSFRGKLAYAAPEVLGGAPHDARADLFSLGVIFHELLTGRRLFAAESDVATFGRVVAAQVPALDFVPAPLEAVCLKLLARLPAERFEHAEEVVAALAVEPTARAQLARVVCASAQRAPVAAPPRRRRGRWVLGGLGVLGLAAVVLVKSPAPLAPTAVVPSPPPDTRRANVNASPAPPARPAAPAVVPSPPPPDTTRGASAKASPAPRPAAPPTVVPSPPPPASPAARTPRSGLRDGGVLDPFAD